MRNSNRIAKEWMLKNGYDDIWFKQHTRHKDTIYTQHYNYKATDLWNLFDGICLDGSHYLVFFQISTNSFHKDEPYIEWMRRKINFGVHDNIKCLLIVVKLKNRRWVVETKEIT